MKPSEWIDGYVASNRCSAWGAQRRADSSEFRANIADPNWRPGDV